MESLTSSRSGMMAWHLSEVLRSHCDQILLCPRFIVVTAWGMLGFVLPTVAIHHLWRNRKRERSGTLLLHPPPPKHTHIHTPFPTPSSPSPSLCGDILSLPRCPPLFIYTCVVKLSLLFFTNSTLHSRRALFLWAMWKDRRGGMCCSSIQKTLSS